MFANVKIIFVLFAVLLGQAAACLQMDFIQQSGTSTFTGWIYDNGDVVCSFTTKSVAGTKFFDCEAGMAAFITADVEKMYFGNGANHWTIDIPEGKEFKINGQVVSIMWFGEWFC